MLCIPASAATTDKILLLLRKNKTKNTKNISFSRKNNRVFLLKTNRININRKNLLVKVNIIQIWNVLDWNDKLCWQFRILLWMLKLSKSLLWNAILFFLHFHKIYEYYISSLYWSQINFTIKNNYFVDTII